MTIGRAEGGGGRANFRLPRLEKQIEKPGSWAAPLACLPPAGLWFSTRKQGTASSCDRENVWRIGSERPFARDDDDGTHPLRHQGGGGRREASSV